MGPLTELCGVSGLELDSVLGRLLINKLKSFSLIVSFSSSLLVNIMANDNCSVYFEISSFQLTARFHSYHGT
jgi:hypothetical protein